MSEIKLLPCPFCKEELEIIGKGHYFAHKSNNGCILQHLCFEIDDEEAVKAWNNRKPVEDLLEDVESSSFTIKPYYYDSDDNDYGDFEVVLLSDAIDYIKEGLME